MESLAKTWNVMQIIKFLKFQVGIISLDSQDPRILEMCKKCQRPCEWTIYQEQRLFKVLGAYKNRWLFVAKETSRTKSPPSDAWKGGKEPAFSFLHLLQLLR